MGINKKNKNRKLEAKVEYDDYEGIGYGSEDDLSDGLADAEDVEIKLEPPSSSSDDDDNNSDHQDMNSNNRKTSIREKATLVRAALNNLKKEMCTDGKAETLTADDSKQTVLDNDVNARSIKRELEKSDPDEEY